MLKILGYFMKRFGFTGCEGNPRELKPMIQYCNWREFLEEIFPKI